MACTVTATQTAACTSGILMVKDQVMLLQIIAELACELANTSVVTAGVGFNMLNSYSSGATASSFTTTSHTPSANALVLVGFSVTAALSVTSVTGNGLTWVQVATGTYGAGGATCYVYRAMGASPTLGGITVNLSGSTSGYSICLSVCQFTGVATSGTNGSGAVVQSATALSSNVTLAAMNANGLNAIVGFTGSSSSLIDQTPKTSWFQDANFSGGGSLLVLFNSYGLSHRLATTDNVYASGANVGPTYRSIALEIAAA